MKKSGDQNTYREPGTYAWPHSPQSEAKGGRVMEPNDLPLDAVSTMALVVRVIDDIDKSSEEQVDTLLCELLCAAWGSVQAQNQ
jgi:hypothetical protein